MRFRDPDTAEDSSPALLTPSRRNLLRALGMAGTAGLAGCATGGGGGDGGDGDATPTPTEIDYPDSTNGNYVKAFSSGAEGLNPLYITEDSTDERVALTLDYSWAVTTDDEVFPMWLVPETDDYKTFTFTVRDGLQWGGDYGQMTAEDWVYTIKNVFQGENNWAGYPNYSDFQGLQFQKTGDMTFEVTLPSKDPAWLLRPIMWGLRVVPKDIVKKYVEMKADGSPDQASKGLQNDEELNNLSFTGNLGAYSFESWQQDSKFVATRNDSYYMRDVAANSDDVGEAWANAPYFEQVTHRVVPELSSRIQALKDGEIDEMLGVPPDRVQEVNNNEGTNVPVQPQPYVDKIAFNMRANGWKPFRKKEVRQAVMMAINKDTIGQDVFRGYAKSAYTMQPTWSEFYSDEQVPKFGSGDLYGADKARDQMETALSESDYEFSYDGDTLVDADGNQVTLSIYAQGSQQTEMTEAQLIAQGLGDIGINVSVNPIQGTTFVKNYVYNSVPEGKKDQVPDDWPATKYNAGPRDVATSNKAWDMSLVYSFNTYPRTPSDSKVFFYERSGFNYYGYVPSEGVDIKAQYEEAANTTDEQERKQKFAEVFGTIAEEQPFGFIVMEDNTPGFASDIVGPVEQYGSGWNKPTYFRK